MIQVDIRPVWRFRSRGEERDFDFTLLALLEAIEREGKLTHAASDAEVSYRHAWNLIDQWGDFLGGPLVERRQGRGTTLTALGRMLLWAGKRVQARLAPQFESLASELSRSINASISEAVPVLAIHASHDFALAGLRGLAIEAGLPVEVQYRGSFDALASLARAECAFAGFHVAEGRLGALMASRYAECVAAEGMRLVSFVRRVQGLIVPPRNPAAIAGVRDLGRGDLRLVNRQRGSGTRALLEFLLSAEGIDRAAIDGYDNEEFTHGAVAAMVAGGQADVGFGLRAAAERFRLGFVPVASERYLFACHADVLETPAGQELLALLRGDAFAAAVGELPGYEADAPGTVHRVAEVLGAGAPATR